MADWTRDGRSIMAFKASWIQEQLQNRLKKLRTDAQLSTQELADRLGWSQSKVSRIETGKNRIDTLDVIKLGQFYGLPDDEVETLCQQARDTRTDIWWRRLEHLLPEQYVRLIGYEDEAELVLTSQSGVFPGLVQTEAYATALIVNGPTAHSDEAADAMIEARMLRQRRLDEPVPLQLDIVVSEAVLHSEYGDADVLRNQLIYVREIAERTNVTFRVARFRNAVYMLPFEVYKFPGGEYAAVAFSETLWSNILHEGPAETKRALKMFKRHVAAALSPEESVKLLDQRIKES